MQTTLFDAILQHLERVSRKADRGGNYTALCPFHSDSQKPNLSIHPQKGFICFACGEKGGLGKLARQLGLDPDDFGDSEPPGQQRSRRGRVTKPKPPTALNDPGAQERVKVDHVRLTSKAQANKRAILYKRGIRDETIMQFKIGLNLQATAFTYPVYSLRGDLINVRFKNLDRNAETKYWNTRGVNASQHVYNVQILRGWKPEDTLYILEGEPDVWVAHQAGLKAICFPCGAESYPEGIGGSLAACGVRTAAVIYDLDDGGHNGAIKLVQALQEDITAHALQLPADLGDKGDVGRLYERLQFDDAVLVQTLADLPTIEIKPKPLPSRPEDQLRAVYLKLRDGTLAEMIYLPDAQMTAFAVSYPDGKIDIVDTMTNDQGRVVAPIPPDNQLLQMGVVLFPSDIGETLTVPVLLDEIRAFIHSYLDVDPFYEQLASYYVLFTWLYDCFTVLPYLRALGDYGTGKSRFLQAIGTLCYRPMFAAGATTAAPVFRIISGFKGTLILDEADFRDSETWADIVKILNCGYMKGFPVLRAEKVNSGNFEVAAYDVYCPKLLGTRKRFSDKALESRMLTKEMEGLTRDDIPIVLPTEFWDEATEIRNLLLAYRLANYGEIPVDAEAVPGIEPRLNQIMFSLQSIIDDPDTRQQLIAFVTEYNRQMVVDRGMSLAAITLEALCELQSEDLFGENPPITLKQVTNRVNEILVSRGELADDDDKGKKTPHKIGRVVREDLHLKTDNSNHRLGTTVLWDEAKIARLKARYGLLEG